MSARIHAPGDADISLAQVWTADGLRLPGVHWAPTSAARDQTRAGAPIPDRACAVVLVHGLTGNVLENPFAHALADTLTELGFGLLYGHNRGFGHVNDLATAARRPDGGWVTRRVGGAYERFAECVHDLEAWAAYGRAQGYRRLLLLGHSLGCSKILFTLGQDAGRIERWGVAGLALASPADMVRYARAGGEARYQAQLGEARRLVAVGEPRRLLSGGVADWFPQSALSFLDVFRAGGPADVLPLGRAGHDAPALASVTVPLLLLYGQHDAITPDPQADLERLRSWASAAPSVETTVIAGASHLYEPEPQRFAAAVSDWAQRVVGPVS